MIVTATLNPSVDRLIYVRRLIAHDTNRILKVEEDAGGKGVNVARVLHRLGVSVVATGFLGGRPGRYVHHELTLEDVPSDFVWVKGDTRTNFAIQEEDGSPPTCLNERGPTISPEELEEFVRKIRQLAGQARFVTVGGSVPPGVPADIYAALAQTVHECGARLVLDADGEPLVKGLEGKPFLIKPNETETERLLGRAIDTLEDAVGAAVELHQQGIEIVIVSIGAKGAAVACAQGCWIAVPPRVQAVSTIGSGDSMIAGFLSALEQGGTVDEALRWGTAGGAATAMTDGSDIGTAEQIRALVPQVEVRCC